MSNRIRLGVGAFIPPQESDSSDSSSTGRQSPDSMETNFAFPHRQRDPQADQQRARNARHNVRMEPLQTPEPQSPLQPFTRSIGIGNNRIGTIPGGVAIRTSSDDRVGQFNVGNGNYSFQATGTGPDGLPRTATLSARRHQGVAVEVTDLSPQDAQPVRRRTTTVPAMDLQQSVSYSDTHIDRRPHRRSTTDTINVERNPTENRIAFSTGRSVTTERPNGNEVNSRTTGAYATLNRGHVQDIGAFRENSHTTPAVPATPFMAAMDGQPAVAASPGVPARSTTTRHAARLTDRELMVRSQLQTTGQLGSDYINAEAEGRFTRDGNDINTDIQASAAFGATSGNRHTSAMASGQLHANTTGRNLQGVNTSGLATTQNARTNIAGLGLDRETTTTTSGQASYIPGARPGQRTQFNGSHDRNTRFSFNPPQPPANNNG